MLALGLSGLVLLAIVGMFAAQARRWTKAPAEARVRIEGGDSCYPKPRQ